MGGAGAAASPRGDGCPANSNAPKKTKKKKSKEARVGVSRVARSSRGPLPSQSRDGAALRKLVKGVIFGATDAARARRR